MYFIEQGAEVITSKRIVYEVGKEKMQFYSFNVMENYDEIKFSYKMDNIYSAIYI